MRLNFLCFTVVSLVLLFKADAGKREMGDHFEPDPGVAQVSKRLFVKPEYGDVLEETEPLKPIQSPEEAEAAIAMGNFFLKNNNFSEAGNQYILALNAKKDTEHYFINGHKRAECWIQSGQTFLQNSSLAPSEKTKKALICFLLALKMKDPISGDFCLLYENRFQVFKAVLEIYDQDNALADRLNLCQRAIFEKKRDQSPTLSEAQIQFFKQIYSGIGNPSPLPFNGRTQRVKMDLNNFLPPIGNMGLPSLGLRSLGLPSLDFSHSLLSDISTEQMNPNDFNF